MDRPDAHPGADVALGWYYRNLPAREAWRFRHHCHRCDMCRTMPAATIAFFHPEPTSEEELEAAIVRGWARLRAMAAEKRAGGAEPTSARAIGDAAR